MISQTRRTERSRCISSVALALSSRTQDGTDVRAATHGHVAYTGTPTTDPPYLFIRQLGRRLLVRESTHRWGFRLLLGIRPVVVLPLVKSLLLVFLLKVKDNIYARHPGDLHFPIRQSFSRSKQIKENKALRGKWTLKFTGFVVRCQDVWI